MRYCGICQCGETETGAYGDTYSNHLRTVEIDGNYPGDVFYMVVCGQCVQEVI